MDKKSNQIFILGAPRSGTTFLASLLDLTYFGKPVETHFITKYYKLLNNYGDISQKTNFNKLLSDILSERAVQQWKLNLDIDKFYTELDGNYSFSNIADKLCLNRNSRLGLSAWGDKTPHYLKDFEILYELFPDAKFMYIVRDGRDVALSLLLKNWGPNNIYACARYWKQLNIEREAFKELEKKGQLISLSYENLLDDIENNVTRIYEFLEQEVSDAEIKKICAPVKKGNYNKWKKKLSKGQIRIFDRVAANTLKRFGYQSFDEETGPGVLNELVYMLHDKLVWLQFMFNTNVIDGFKIRFLGKEPFAE